MSRFGQPFGNRTRVQHETYDRWQNYGQKREITPPWSRDEQKIVLKWDQATDLSAMVHSLMLSLVQADAPENNFAWRWVLDFGVGGVRRTFEIDAFPSQLISVPISSVAIHLKSVIADVNLPYFAPTHIVSPSAYIAMFPLSSRLAQLTDPFAVPAATGQLFTPPVGAQAFRIVGPHNGGVSDPFVAGMTYQIGAGVWTGPDLVQLHTTDGYIPLPGSAALFKMTITNTTGTTRLGGIEWGIDF